MYFRGLAQGRVQEFVRGGWAENLKGFFLNNFFCFSIFQGGGGSSEKSRENDISE